MDHNKQKRRLSLIYGILFLTLLITEVLIALYVRDAFIRPYGGDILVTLLICSFISVFFPKKIKLLPVWVFIFALGVEVLQYFDFVTLLGLSDNRFFSILLGSVFSFADVVCYGAGCVLFFLIDRYLIK